MTDKIATGEFFAELVGENFCELNPKGVSRLHEFLDYAKNHENKIRAIDRINSNGDLVDININSFPNLEDAPAFVIQHNWCEILKDIGDITDEEVRLPVLGCVFEFSFRMMHVIFFTDDDLDLIFIFSKLPSGRWTGYLTELKEAETQNFNVCEVWKQVKAMCVALDAEVVETEIIRAPEKLNRKRIKKGKKPRNDYHIVNLTRRYRISNPHGGHSGIKHRLHFRRGHWRHYEDHKTWVKWCLAGDPDLGFVDKHYTM